MEEKSNIHSTIKFFKDIGCVCVCSEYDLNDQNLHNNFKFKKSSTHSRLDTSISSKYHNSPFLYIIYDNDTITSAVEGKITSIEFTETRGEGSFRTGGKTYIFNENETYNISNGNISKGCVIIQPKKSFLNFFRMGTGGRKFLLKNKKSTRRCRNKKRSTKRNRK